jgi:rhodanese-related sulfurtransferase
MKIRVLDWDAAAAEIANGATILDLRDATLFGRGHLVGSIHIKAKSPNFAERVRRFTQATKPMLFVADHLDEADGAARELAGIRSVAGVTSIADPKPKDTLIDELGQLEPSELYQCQLDGSPIVVLDVREQVEWAEGSIRGASRIPNERAVRPHLPSSKGFASRNHLRRRATVEPNRKYVEA